MVQAATEDLKELKARLVEICNTRLAEKDGGELSLDEKILKQCDALDAFKQRGPIVNSRHPSTPDTGRMVIIYEKRAWVKAAIRFSQRMLVKWSEDREVVVRR
eukprot:FR734754.1.p2 GENE.FR734754.1~~FR734754.1.p2  ORF type:complete len:103 (+),score=7.42 FR734754.1:435-743(+)